jgi:AcrR family transcriptional regulator
MGIPERKEREKEHRREEIIRAATVVFFEKGLQAATMDEIAEKAELSKGTLYLYYKSKEDLYLAVMNVGIDTLREMFENTVRSSASTIETLLRLGETYYQFFRAHRNYFRMFHFFQNPAFHKQVSDEMLLTCRDKNQSIWTVVTGVLANGIKEGVLRSDLRPEEMAVVLWSSSNAIMMQMDHQNERWKETLAVDLEVVLRKANRLLLDAILTESARQRLRAEALDTYVS